MDEFVATMDYEFERDSEGFKDFGSMQLFKSKYKLNRKKESRANKDKSDAIRHHYVISNDNRTYVIRFLSKKDTDFDPYISKTIF